MPITPAVGDGVRTEFFFARNIVPQLLAVYADGMRMIPGADYELILPRRIRFSLPPSVGADFVADMHEYPALFQGKFATYYIQSEVPQGLINGANQNFVLYSTPVAGSVRVYLDGLHMVPATDYTMLTQTTVQFLVAPAVSSTVLVDYIQDRTEAADFAPKFIFNEIPTQITAVAYRTANNYALGHVQVYKNGLRMKKDVEYTEVGPNNVVFAVAPAPADVIIVDYCKFS